jgi:hypothetical protein
MGVPPQPTPGISGLSWLGVEHTSNLPPACTHSQAQPLPKRVAPAVELLLEGIEGPEVPHDGGCQLAAGHPPSVRCHHGPEQGVVVVSATIVANGHVGHVKLPHQNFERLVGIGRSFQRLVQVGHVGLVVLAVVDLHGSCVDVRFKRIVGIGEGGECVGHGGGVCRLDECLRGRVQRYCRQKVGISWK